MAIKRVAQDSYGVAPDDAAHGACRLPGFGRVTDEMRIVIDAQRDTLIAADRLVLRGESVLYMDTSTSADHAG